jgi:HNH endonuclease
MSFERNEVEAAYERRDYLLSNYVERDGPLETKCWIWQRSIVGKMGYGEVCYNHVHYRVHRLMWIWVNGPIPDELFCLHRCDRPSCINPDHLFLGDDGDNARDRNQKGRAASQVGSLNANASCRESDVEEILQLVGEGKSDLLIASQFGMSESTVRRIARGLTWGHVSGLRRKALDQIKHSPFKGVSKGYRGRWRAFASGKYVHLGSFDTELEAAAARNGFDLCHGRPPSNDIPCVFLPCGLEESWRAFA